MSINRGMNWEDVVHMYNGILLSHKKEWNNAICSTMDGFREYHTKWTMSDRERQISYDITYVWNLGFPSSSAGKESACHEGDPGSIPESGRSTGEGIGYPLQYSWAFLVAQLVKNLGPIPGSGKSPAEEKEYSIGLLWVLKISVYKNAPADSHAAGPEATLWESLAWTPDDYIISCLFSPHSLWTSLLHCTHCI